MRHILLLPSFAAGAALVKTTLSDSEASAAGARALDGSPYAYYTSTANKGAADWIIYLEGGGECAECVPKETTLSREARDESRMIDSL